MEEKLKKLVEVSGNGTNVKGLEDIDLDADWDPEEHDRKMHEIYGGDYQAVDDVSPFTWRFISRSLVADLDVVRILNSNLLGTTISISPIYQLLATMTMTTNHEQDEETIWRKR